MMEVESFYANFMILQGEGRGEEARCDESANICKYAGKKGENFATSKHVKLIDEFITLIFDIIFLFKSEILALVLYFKGILSFKAQNMFAMVKKSILLQHFVP